jgi:hypothetical protein
MSVDEVIKRHADYAAETEHVLYLSMQGLHWIYNQPAAMKAIDNWELVTEEYDENIAKKRRERAEKEATFVKKEVDQEFPLLHAHAIIDLWSTTESCIEEILIEWLIENQKYLKNRRIF